MVLFRVDLLKFPDFAPSEWLAAGCNTLELTLMFLGVEDFSAAVSGLPSEADITGSLTDGRRALFTISGGDDFNGSFVADSEVRTGHISGYRRTEAGDGAEASRHHFLGRIDRKLYESIPPPWSEGFHANV